MKQQLTDTTRSYDEPLLLNRISEGDREAFHILHDRYWNDLFHISLSFLKSVEWSQDIIQDTFIAIWEKRASLPEIDNFKAYLFTAARHRLINALRSKMRMENRNENYREQLPHGYVQDSITVKEIEKHLHNALERLPEQQRNIFQMARAGGLTHDEIAARLGIARKTVANTITRTLNYLREYLSVYGNDLAIFFLAILSWLMAEQNS